MLVAPTNAFSGIRVTSLRPLSHRISSIVILAYFACIFLMPRIPGIPLRLEDIFFPVFVMVALLNIGKVDLRFLVLPIAYAIYIVLFCLFGIALQNVDVRGLSIAIKEVQYIVGFVLLLGALSWTELERSQLLMRLSVLLWIPCLYGVSMIASNRIGYYGISSINETSPSLSGQMYFSAFVMSLILYHSLRQRLLLLQSFLLAICTLMVGSRTAAAMLIIFLILSRVRVSWRLVLFLLLVCASAFLLYFGLDYYIANYYDSESVVDRAIKRARSLFFLMDSLAPRFESWEVNRFDTELHPLSVLFGHGRGYENMNPDGSWRGFELNVDSQYIRDFFEVGLVGALLKFGAMLWTSTFLDKRMFYYYFAYFISFCAAGMTMELFNLSKPGALFWAVSGLFLICSRQKGRSVS